VLKPTAIAKAIVQASKYWKGPPKSIYTGADVAERITPLLAEMVATPQREFLRLKKFDFGRIPVHPEIGGVEPSAAFYNLQQKLAISPRSLLVRPAHGKKSFRHEMGHARVAVPEPSRTEMKNAQRALAVDEYLSQTMSPEHYYATSINENIARSLEDISRVAKPGGMTFREFDSIYRSILKRELSRGEATAKALHEAGKYTGVWSNWFGDLEEILSQMTPGILSRGPRRKMQLLGPPRSKASPRAQTYPVRYRGGK